MHSVKKIKLNSHLAHTNLKQFLIASECEYQFHLFFKIDLMLKDSMSNYIATK